MKNSEIMGRLVSWSACLSNARVDLSQERFDRHNFEGRLKLLHVSLGRFLRDWDGRREAGTDDALDEVLAVLAGTPDDAVATEPAPALAEDEGLGQEAVNVQTDAEEIVEQLERSFTDETPGAFEKYIAAALARAEVVRTALLALAARKVAGLPRCPACGAALLDGAGCDPKCGGDDR